jgi:hypothetical protein
MRTLLVPGVALVGALAFLPSHAQAPVATAAPATAAAPAGSKVWLGHYAEYEEYLRTAAIAKVDAIPIGVTKPKRAFFEPGGMAASATLKYLPARVKGGFWEAHTSEVAAYKLDRILGLDMVPPTIERRVGPDVASLQLWVEGCRLVKDLDQTRRRSPSWVKQVCRHRAFDNLIANIDRNAGNLLVDPEWNLILIDHSRAFARDTMPFMKEMTRVDREFYEKLKALDEETLTRELEPWLPPGRAIPDLLKRRDKIVARFDELARKKSALEVFPF